MILDHIESAKKYETLRPAFAAAMQFLYEHKNGGLADGRYAISDDAYALVKHYDTKEQENCKYEAHREYIDVQYLVSGDEYMGWAPVKKMSVGAYNADKDLYSVTGDGELYPLHGGEFMILFPEDAHMPNMKNGSVRAAEKIILKIRADA